jgi:amidophosphoribosyltransferase
VKAVQKGNPKLQRFDCSMFTGKYVTNVSRNYLELLERERNDITKQERAKQYADIDLHSSV